MSFSNKIILYYHIIEFYYYLLSEYIKIPTMLKRQQFKKNKDNAIEIMAEKYTCVNEHDKEERQS